MNYREIISWAEDKINHEEKQRTFDIEVDKIFPIRIFNESNDAVRELVLECCDTTARTPMSEINILNNEDMICVNKKHQELKSDIEKAIDYLEKAYDTVQYFSDKIEKGIKEIKRGDKSISDLEEEIKWDYPQTFNFIECNKILNNIINNL